MEWKKLNSEEEIGEMIQKSIQTPQVIFKHSSRCSLSSMALGRLKSAITNVDYNLVDVIGNRNISNFVANKFGVIHQSPQVLIINQEKCVFDTSHFNISMSAIEKEINTLHEV